MRRPWSARAKRRLIRVGVCSPPSSGLRRSSSSSPSRTVRPRRSATCRLTFLPRRRKRSPPARSCGSSSIGETDEFVRTAVRRNDLAASWHLIHPNLKQGMTKEQWLTGDIPVVPFPAKGILAWELDWAYAEMSQPMWCSSRWRRAASTARRSRSSSSASAALRRTVARLLMGPERRLRGADRRRACSRRAGGPRERPRPSGACRRVWIPIP